MSQINYCGCGFSWKPAKSNGFHECTGQQKSPCDASSQEGREELRPCPFCGKPPIVDVMGQIYCNNKPPEPHGEGCRIFAKGKLYGWNSAWCWKEIDRLKSKNESRDAEVESFIPSGWEFDTADFSIRGADGYVCLRRDKKGTEWWHGLSEEDRERTDLYVYGRASSLVQAIKNAVSNVREESK